MVKVTYLMGAGASANTIPIVSGISQRFNEIIDYLKKYQSAKSHGSTYESWPIFLKTHIKEIDSVIDDLIWLTQESQKHQTIDTLAKKYYLTQDDRLFRLKKTLIQYFILEQLIFIPSKTFGDLTEEVAFIKRKEFRYDSFFAALFDKNGKDLSVRSNVKIFTWNYDQQIELALQNYVQKKISSVKEKFQILPHDYSINGSSDLFFQVNQFGTIKLNGNAIWTPIKINGAENIESALDYYDSDLLENERLGLFLKELYDIRTVNGIDHIKNSLRQMNFSWEEDREFKEKYNKFDQHRNIVKEIAKNTDILVIIGYSFPVFNRQVDKMIVENIKGLKKIYIQDPNCESIKSTLVNGFEGISRRAEVFDSFFHLQQDTSQFLIPFELS